MSGYNNIQCIDVADFLSTRQFPSDSRDELNKQRLRLTTNLHYTNRSIMSNTQSKSLMQGCIEKAIP